MLVLAFDTSSSSGAIGLFDDGRLVAECLAGNPGVHAEWLLKSIDGLLASSRRDIKDVGLFALTTGPGSFTGLRIGISTVKGLAWGCGKKVAGVSTLEALALNLRYSSLAICPVLDARKGELYAALYRSDKGGLYTLMPECAITPAALLDKLKALCGPEVVFIGGGVSAAAAVIDGLPGCSTAPEPLRHIRAANIAELAVKSAPKGPEEITPVYLRKSEAEIKAAGAKTL